MTAQELIHAICSVKGVRIRNLSTVGPGEVTVILEHTLLSWFWPPLRRRRMGLVDEAIRRIRPTNISIIVLFDK